MSIASTTFLFLFLPLSVGVYYLLPRGNGLKLRNIFLLLVSLGFYAWGEPVFVVLPIALSVLTWLLGKLAEGRKNTLAGKTAVFLTVFLNIGVLLLFKELNRVLSAAGLLLGTDLSSMMRELPIGMSFFCFHSVSYVVDVYRGQVKGSRSFLNTSLYLCVFYKVLQGPIVSYREFEPQIHGRSTTWDNFSKGTVRFAVGLGKKMLIATNLVSMVQYFFTTEFADLSAGDAWLGCIAYMVFAYFDFSGYSDMAIGLAGMFGFQMPENFNYPYLSTSVGEYWRRWHITLCAWFRDYLYFPILLGPSVRFRKFLLKHRVSSRTAKTLQTVFVPTCVWIATALWHGTNWNYTLWGLINCFAMILEQHIKPMKHKKAEKLLRWAGVMLLLALTKPLVCTENLTSAVAYFRAMFFGNGLTAFSDTAVYFLRTYGIILLFGILGCFPICPALKGKFYPKTNKALQTLWDICEVLCLIAIVVLSIAMLLKTGSAVFMYQQL